MARFTQTFRVRAPLSAVWALHEDPAVLPALTPPPLQVKLLALEKPIRAGSTMQFWLGFGPVGVIWNVSYDEFVPYQNGLTTCHFVDREISGPFHSWKHRHTFTDLGDGTSTVRDEAQFELLGGVLGRVVTWLFGWPAIAFLFLFRRIKTQSLLRSGKYS